MDIAIKNPLAEAKKFNAVAPPRRAFVYIRNKKIKNPTNKQIARVAQSVERQTLNLNVASSSLAVGSIPAPNIRLFFRKKIYKNLTFFFLLSSSLLFGRMRMLCISFTVFSLFLFVFYPLNESICHITLVLSVLTSLHSCYQVFYT